MWDCRLLRMTPSGEWMHNECMLANGYKKANVWRWCLRCKKVGDKSRWTQSPIPRIPDTHKVLELVSKLVVHSSIKFLVSCILYRATQYTLCVYTVLASCTGYCLGRASHAWRWDNGVVAPSAGGSRLPWQRTPTTNPFLTNSKKSDGRNMLQTHINTVEARTFPTVHTATHRAR